ncbi:MAG TPA: hypothetical protein VFB96_08865 [Pirellulaceae bacterium]|nr:hypothetical protein [Pirellulaceae bacterium]
MKTLLFSALSLTLLAAPLAAQEYELAHKFTPGEEIRTQVVHLVTVESKIKGFTQTAKTRSVSTRMWKIVSVDAKGNITLDNSVEAVSMWQSHTDDKGVKEVSYDSQKDVVPPPVYEAIAKTVGITLATITIDPAGKIIDRRSNQPNFNPGIGELTVPLPGKKVKIGDTWFTPEVIPLRTEEGMVKRIDTRQLYKLEKVELGVATISVVTQVLTPISDPKLESQLVQRLQKGTIKFDIDAGRLMHKQMDLDESVLGFAGADSSMQYLARLTEEPLKNEEARAKSGGQKR